MKWYFKRDTLLATIFVYVLSLLIFEFGIMRIMEPGKLEPYDMHYTDLSYAFDDDDHKADPDIVFVNIGNADRATLAFLLDKINSGAPRAIGLDATFERRADSGNALLAAAVQHIPNLVICNNNWEGQREESQFAGIASHIATSRFPGNGRTVIRGFRPFVNNRKDTAFAVMLAHLAYPEKTREFLSGIEHHDTDESVIIDYSYRQHQERVIQFGDILNGKTDVRSFNGKVVLAGYCPENFNDIIDCHFTPMNENLLHRPMPDMRGVFIHGNIISMINAGHLKHEAPHWVNWLISIIFCWWCTGTFIRFVSQGNHWFHIWIKFALFGIWLILIYLEVAIYRRFDYKVEFLFSEGILLLCVELLFLYNNLKHRFTRHHH